MAYFSRVLHLNHAHHLRAFLHVPVYLHADDVARHLGQLVWRISSYRPYRRNQHVSRLPAAWHSLVFLQPGLASPFKLHPAGRDSPPCSSSSTPPLSSIPWLMRKKPTACPLSGQIQVKPRRGKLPWHTANEEGASLIVPLTTNGLANRPVFHSTCRCIYCFTVPKMLLRSDFCTCKVVDLSGRETSHGHEDRFSGC